jgi:hypothetical protein
MNGQWIGRYSGTNSELLVIDCDDMEMHYEGRAFAYDENPASRVHLQGLSENRYLLGSPVPLIESLKSKAHLIPDVRKGKNLTHLQ